MPMAASRTETVAKVQGSVGLRPGDNAAEHDGPEHCQRSSDGITRSCQPVIS